MRPAVDAIIYERVIVCACKVTRPTRWRRRRWQRVCNFAHSLENRPLRHLLSKYTLDDSLC